MPVLRLRFAQKMLITLRHNSSFCASFNQKTDYSHSKNQTTKKLQGIFLELRAVVLYL
ncbi:MAG: hypothetical protein ACI94Y_003557 [Maribacter sp.]|jgi:hypothetical protein